jgi:DNA-binding HxlR family transcriptional regulator
MPAALRAPQDLDAPVTRTEPPNENFNATYGLMRRLGNRWTVPILLALRCEPLRFAKLKRTLDPVSQRMLTLSLRRMEQDDLVCRTELPGQPPPVTYGLTPLAAELVERLEEVEACLAAHRIAHECTAD